MSEYTYVETRECCKCGMVWSRMRTATEWFQEVDENDACGWCGRGIKTIGWKYRNGYLLVHGRDEDVA
jgi:hypothetical protein